MIFFKIILNLKLNTTSQSEHSYALDRVLKDSVFDALFDTTDICISSKEMCNDNDKFNLSPKNKLES